MSGLSCGAPVHSGWNLAHICRLIPEAHALFATPPGCSRIIRLSAIEKNMSERFTTLDITKEDITFGSAEEKILRFARETIIRLKEDGRLPKAFIIFVSCIDSFIGTDHAVYLDALKREFPEIRFLDCAMDPINREIKPPIVRMQEEICSLFDGSEKIRAVNWIGRFLPVNTNNELKTHLEKHGIASLHAYDCRTMDELKKMGGSMMNIVAHPSAVSAAKELENRLGMPWVPVLCGDAFKELPNIYDRICAELQIPPLDINAVSEEVHAAIKEAADAVKGWKIAVSDDADFFPYALAAQLLDHGFDISYVFAGQPAPPERDAARRLADMGVKFAGESADMARAFADGRFALKNTAAVGAEAAYYTKTKNFVQRIAFGGDAGFYALKNLAEDIVKAAEEDKDVRCLMSPGRGCAAL